jgi:YVTN family beta-propeller protein
VTVTEGVREVEVMVRRSFVLIAALAIGASACSREASPPTSSAPAATPAPAPAATPQPGPRLFVSDETGGAVIVIDPVSGQVLERISVGKRPRGVRVREIGGQKLLFVALSGSPIAGPGVDESKLPPPDRAADGVGVVDLATRKLVRTLNTGQDPESFDLSPDGKTLYVSNEETAEMSVVDIANGNITTRVKVGEEPEGVTVRPDGREVYITCEGTNEVFAIDTAALKVAGHMKTAPRPRAVAFTLDGTTAFVTAETAATVSVIDAQKHQTAGAIKIPKPEGAPADARPMGAVLSPDGTQLFVSLGRSRAVGVIDVKTRALTKTIMDVGDRPWGIGVSADGHKVYTANGPSGDVSVVDVASGKVEQRIKTGGSPWGVAVATEK